MTFGFVVVRHVNNEQTNKYWIECLRCIRKYYPFENVLIVDDSSDPEFLNSNGINMTNVEVVQSEFPKCGELLGYYYFHKLKPFEKGIILHDSAFIQRRINFENINLAFLWSFESTYIRLLDGKIFKTNDEPENDIRLLSYLKNSQPLLEKYKSDQFVGCFGVMSVIHGILLDYFVEKYDLFKLLEHVNTRKLRMSVERVFAVIFSKENNEKVPTICGDIFNHPMCYELNFDMYKDLVNSLETEEIQRKKNIFKLKAKNPLLNYQIFKVWTGR
jgi:hypothetical protein